MAIVEQENYDICPIPMNSEFDINIGNFSFELKRLVEAVIVGGALGVLSFLILSFLGLSFLRKIAFTILFVVAGGALALKGINGNSLSEYVIYVILHNKNKRITYYNKRVKIEKKFFTQDTEDQYVVPRERLEAMYHKYVAKPETNKEVFNEEFDESRMFFESDIDVCGKPEALMSKRELKKYQKLKKKEEKERLNQARKEKNVKKTKQKKIAGIR